MTGFESPERSSNRIVSILRLLAMALLVVGFIGMVTSDHPMLDTSNVYTLLFGAGVIAAIGSIYLGIFLHTPE